MSLKDDILAAAKATMIPESESGLWTVRRLITPTPMFQKRDGKHQLLPAGTYTFLNCFTEATLHTHGEVVMEDTPVELNKHLDFMLRAYGRVLITGLGLGCVVRGCLANPDVKEIVCVERCKDVLQLVSPHMPEDGRLKIVVADARKWVPEAVKTNQFDCAWHDLWTNPDYKEPHLQIWHNQLIVDSLAGKVKLIGAWNFPREHRRCVRRIVAKTRPDTVIV